VQSSSAESIDVTYRGLRYRLPAERLILDGAGPIGGSVCLWPPRNDESAVREQWIADTVVRGFGCFEATGKSPQEALDALDRVLPPGPMVRGGSC
jgi:hypothetical protein